MVEGKYGDMGHYVTLESGTVIFIAESAGMVPPRLRAEKGAAKRFTRAGLQRALIEHHRNMTGESGGYTDAMDRELTEAAGSSSDAFRFYKKLPADIKQEIAANPALGRPGLFTVTQDKSAAHGEDAYGQLGDRYIQIAEAKAGSPIRAALQTARESQDPEIEHLAAVHENLPDDPGALKARATKLRKVGKTKRADRLEALAAATPGTEAVKAGGLRFGDRFTHGGQAMRVAEDQRGMRVLTGSEAFEGTPVDALTHVPIDRGSLRPGALRRRNAAKPAAVHHDDVPFSRYCPEPPILLSMTDIFLGKDGGPAQTGSKGDWGIFREVEGQTLFYKLDSAGHASLPASEEAHLKSAIARHRKQGKEHQAARDNAKVRGKAEEAGEHHEAAQRHIKAEDGLKATNKKIAAPKTAEEHEARADEHSEAARKASEDGDAEMMERHYKAAGEHAKKAEELRDPPPKPRPEKKNPPAVSQTKPEPRPEKQPPPSADKPVDKVQSRTDSEWRTKATQHAQEWRAALDRGDSRSAKMAEYATRYAESKGDLNKTFQTGGLGFGSKGGLLEPASEATRLSSHEANLHTLMEHGSYDPDLTPAEHAAKAEQIRGVGSAPDAKKIHEAVTGAIEELRANHKSKLVPIHEIRQKVADKLGLAAASHAHLDPVIESGNHKLLSITDLRGSTSDTNANALPRSGRLSQPYYIDAEGSAGSKNLSLSPPRLTCISDILLDKGGGESGKVYFRTVGGVVRPFSGIDPDPAESARWLKHRKGEIHQAMQDRQSKTVHVKTSEGTHVVTQDQHKVQHTDTEGKTTTEYHNTQGDARRAAAAKAAHLEHDAHVAGNHVDTGSAIAIDDEVAAGVKQGHLTVPTEGGEVDPHLAEAYQRHAASLGHTVGEWKIDKGTGLATATLTKSKAANLSRIDLSRSVTCTLREAAEFFGVSPIGLGAAPRLTCMADVELGWRDQLRVPAGSPDGGEFSSAAGDILENPQKNELQALFDTVHGEHGAGVRGEVLRGTVTRSGHYTWGSGHHYTHEELNPEAPTKLFIHKIVDADTLEPHEVPGVGSKLDRAKELV